MGLGAWRLPIFQPVSLGVALSPGSSMSWSLLCICSQVLLRAKLTHPRGHLPGGQGQACLTQEGRGRLCSPTRCAWAAGCPGSRRKSA